jgi:hypothetical protein
LAGGPERTSKLPLEMERRTRNETSIKVKEIDKQGTTNEAGYVKDELERLEASVQLWLNMKRADRRNTAEQQESSRMTRTCKPSGTTSLGVGPTT